MGLYNHQLETFLNVADSGSFRKAAENLYISPTAVQKQINLLEDSLGTLLFQRTHHGLTLTGAGRSLYADAKYLLSFSNEAEMRLRTYKETEYSEVRAAYSPISPLLCISAMWPHIHKADPSFRLIIVPRSDDPMTKSESVRNLGVAIDMIETAYDEDKCHEAGMDYLHLETIPLGFVLPSWHPLAEKHQICLGDLENSGTRLIIPRRGLNRYSDQVRNELVERRTVEILEIEDYTVDSYNICIRENCAMLALNPAVVHPLLVYKKASWDFTIPYGLLYSAAPSPIVRDFIRIIRLQMENKNVRDTIHSCLPCFQDK
ncbi:MAG: LysR family transcriptional regulator [Solobacterium sp.]|nr:LysR family transcriptional regulator [Solobacterium sp.]